MPTAFPSVPYHSSCFYHANARPNLTRLLNGDGVQQSPDNFDLEGGIYGVRVEVGRELFVIVFVRLLLIVDELVIEFPLKFALLVDIFEFMFDVEFMLDTFELPVIVFVEPPSEFEFIEFELELALYVFMLFDVELVQAVATMPSAAKVKSASSLFI